MLDGGADFAVSHETPWPRDLRAHLEAGSSSRRRINEILGPIRARGGPNGLILRRGAMVASWGDTRQVDFTFSVAKSYLEPAGGHCRGRRADCGTGRAGGGTVDDGGFDGPHNGAITWRHLLQQTSEWEGTLFGKSDMSTAIATSRWRARAARATRGRCGRRARSGNITTSG